MKNCEKEKNIKELENLEVQCDIFLETLQTMGIWELNLERPEEPLITADTPGWMSFQDGLLKLLSKHTKDFDDEYEKIHVLYLKAVQYANSKNIGNLKVAINSLKKQIIKSSEDNVLDGKVDSLIHPLIKMVSMNKFNDGYYADAVESAFKEINSRIKRLYMSQCGEEKDGADLMRKAFSPNAPVLLFEDNASQSGRNVQQGYMDIFAGAMTGIRNPKAHENMSISEVQAAQRLVFASLLMTKIDEAVKFTKIEE